MFPLHCDNCGRIIGRAERESFEGRTVCGRCLQKLGGAGTPLEGKQAMKTTVIIAAITTVVGGAALLGLLKILSTLNH